MSVLTQELATDYIILGCTLNILGMEMGSSASERLSVGEQESWSTREMGEGQEGMRGSEYACEQELGRTGTYQAESRVDENAGEWDPRGAGSLVRGNWVEPKC